MFDTGAYSEIQAVAAKWSSDLPVEIRTPCEALFDVDLIDIGQPALSRNKLKQAILDLHNVPTEDEWFDALVESWEFKRKRFGADANAFFKLEKSVAEEHLRRLAKAIFGASASVLKFSQPLVLKSVRDIAATQSLILREMESFRPPLNNATADRSEAVSLNLDVTHIEEGQLHLLNEMLCVDSPAEVIAGRYRTHKLWIGPDGCSEEGASYVPIQPQYVESKTKYLLQQWNHAAVDLAKLDADHVTSAVASFHHRFLEIHPYPDGNGRVARAILDLQVRNFALAGSPLRLKSHAEYYLALRAADDGDLAPLIALLTSILKRNLGDRR